MARKKYIPKRGDIVWTNFDSAAGHEQMGKRPALILSPESFNKKILLAMAAPITSRVRGHGFEVPLNTKQIKGVEKAPEAVTSDVLARVRAIVSEE
jgi:mRNA interferase MazF